MAEAQQGGHLLGGFRQHHQRRLGPVQGEAVAVVGEQFLAGPPPPRGPAAAGGTGAPSRPSRSSRQGSGGPGTRVAFASELTEARARAGSLLGQDGLPNASTFCGSRLEFGHPFSARLGPCSPHHPIGGDLRRRPETDAGRRQLTGAGLQVRRRPADRLRPGQGRLRLGRGRQPLHRLRGKLGARHLRPQPSRGDRGPARGPGEGNQLRRPLRSGERAGGAGDRGGALGGDGAVRQLRHRGLHGRAAADAGLHRPGEADQVRGLLPRPRRHVPGESRLRGGHPGAARFPRRAPFASPPTPSPPPTTAWSRSSGCSPTTPARSPA